MMPQLTDGCCQSCGQTLPREDTLSEKVSGPIKKAIVVRLLRAGPRGVTKAALFSWLYDNDPDGGPDQGGKSICVHISQLRKAVNPYGYEIENINPCGGRGGEAVYRLREFGEVKS